MDNFRDSYFNVNWDLTTKYLRGTYWGKQYDTGRGFAVTVINGGQVVTPTNEVLRLKWEKPDNTTGYVNATIVNGKFIVENIDQMFTVQGSVRADFELSVGGESLASITFYVSVEKAVAVDAVASSSEFTALQTAIATVDGLDADITEVKSQLADVTLDISKTVKQVNGVSPNASGNVSIEVPKIDDTNLLRGIASVTEPHNPTDGLIWFKITLPESPKPPVVDYVLRLDAHDLILQNDGSNVTLWKNSGTLNKDFTPSGSNIPKISKNGFEGKPCVVFNKGGLQNQSFNINISNGYTIFFVGQQNTVVSQNLITLDAEGNTEPLAFMFSRSTAIHNVKLANLMEAHKKNLGTGKILFSASKVDTEIKAWEKGILYSTQTFGEALSNTTKVGIGTALSGSYVNVFDGKICEVMIFERGLSVSEVDSMNTHLMTKWGI